MVVKLMHKPDNDWTSGILGGVYNLVRKFFISINDFNTMYLIVSSLN